MKINIQVEVDTESEQDLTTIEELIAIKYKFLNISSKIFLKYN